MKTSSGRGLEVGRGRERVRRCAAAAALVFVASGCAIQPNDNTLPGQVAVGDDGYGVTVIFDGVENLVPNSQVLKGDVVIGTVASIEVVDWQARVDLRLLDAVELPASSVFSIGQKTLLGAQYVEVVDPTSQSGDAGPAGATTTALAGTSTGMLEDQAVVPVSQTGSYPATEQVLGAVALLLNNGGLSQISTITSELSTALRGRTPDARSLVRTSNELLAVLDDNKGEIIRALESLDRLTSGLAQDRDRVARAIDRITPGLRSLEEERGRLVEAVTATGRAGTTAIGVIQTSERALLANLDALQPILTNLGKASTELPEALKIAITIPFPAMTTENALRGDFANLFATFDLRTNSLSESFAGVDIASLLSGLPLPGPLPVPAPPSSGPDRGPGSKPGGRNSDDAGPRTNGSDASAPCLLTVLGLC